MPGTVVKLSTGREATFDPITLVLYWTPAFEAEKELCPLTLAEYRELLPQLPSLSFSDLPRTP